MNANPCASAETLEGLLQGSLSDRDADAVRAHLSACPACQAALDRLSDHFELQRWKSARPPSGADDPRLAGLLP